MTANTRELCQRFLTLMGNGPIREKPLPVRISRTNSAYIAAAATKIRRSGQTPATGYRPGSCRRPRQRHAGRRCQTA